VFSVVPWHTEHVSRTERGRIEAVKSITENGVLGDPMKAIPEAGEEIIQNVVETYVQHIKTERDAV